MSVLFVNLKTPNGHSYQEPTGLFINNIWVMSSSGLTITSLDPAIETEIGAMQAADVSDNLPATERGKLLVRLSELIEAKKELLATIGAWDNGKTYALAMEDDLPDTIGTFRYFGGWADKNFGQTIETTPEKFAYTLRQPIGVVAQIIPWNFPLAMAAWKLAPALACGNTVEAGFPPGVVKIINGYGRETGTALIEHPLITKIAFTGSTDYEVRRSDAEKH
ncbi:Aldehyde/histidinol dehydrogenase [Aspergillus heterothallicus]